MQICLSFTLQTSLCVHVSALQCDSKTSSFYFRQIHQACCCHESLESLMENYGHSCGLGTFCELMRMHEKRTGWTQKSALLNLTRETTAKISFKTFYFSHCPLLNCLNCQIGHNWLILQHQRLHPAGRTSSVPFGVADH